MQTLSRHSLQFADQERCQTLSPVSQSHQKSDRAVTVQLLNVSSIETGDAAKYLPRRGAVQQVHPPALRAEG